jgi:3-oxoacyl-[acyl-carrier-protein] synthase II
MREVVAITGGGAVTSRDAATAALPDAVRARATRAERVTQLVLLAAGRALAAAGLDATEGAPRPRLGVVLGTAFGCFLTNAAFERRLLEGSPAAASPRLFAATVSNAAAGELAIAYRLGGPSVTLTAGAASGLVALGHAVDLLRAGRADALVAGGADALDDDLHRWLAAGGLGAGRVPAEAAAVLVLERAELARMRGRAILGTVEGVAAGFEPDPAGARAGEGLAGAVAMALGEAGIAPAEVRAAVSAAPPGLAGLESRALAGVAPRTVVRPKDVLGETFGAAGVLGLLAALAETPPGAALLVLDVCASGHVAALVARAGDGR